MKRTRPRLVLAAIVAVAALGTGGAIAATGLGTPQEESKAILEDAAGQLGVDAAKLGEALKKALANRVDAAVAAGQLTEDQGAALKERIQSDDFPVLGHGPRGHGHHGHRGAKLETAAEYLGLTREALRAELRAGKSLADVARDKGKSVDGLVDALVAEKRERLAQAVAAGRLTQAQADELSARLKERVTERVNGVRPSVGPGFGPRGSVFGGAAAPGTPA